MAATLAVRKLVPALSCMAAPMGSRNQRSLWTREARGSADSSTGVWTESSRRGAACSARTFSANWIGQEREHHEQPEPQHALRVQGEVRLDYGGIERQSEQRGDI